MILGKRAYFLIDGVKHHVIVRNKTVKGFKVKEYKIGKPFRTHGRKER